jgi:anion-transporting  ArsA/GET3 family ATPase
VRLLNDLTFEAPIKVRNVVVNQVLGNDTNDARSFLSHLRTSQKASIEELEKAAMQLVAPRPVITTVPYLDTEPRGVFGLKVLSEELLRETEESLVEIPTAI